LPLETATFISDLVPSNPAASDGLNNADDHMRMIKGTLKNTFPNVAGAANASHTELNGLLAQLKGTTAYKAPRGTVALPAYAFVDDPDTGWYSPASKRAALALGGVDALNFRTDKTADFAAGASFAGPVSAGGPISGPGSCPIGTMVMWMADTLPTGFGAWCWANGGTLSRTQAGAGKELFDLWGTRYGTGDGATTFNVINMQEVVPVGKSTMGGAASPGLLASIGTGLKAVLGGLFGADSKTLDMTNVPEHDHAVYLKDNQHQHAAANPSAFIMSGQGVGVGGGGAFGTASPGATGTALASSNITIGSASGVANDNKTAKSGNAAPTPFALAQPSRAVNFIIRIG